MKWFEQESCGAATQQASRSNRSWSSRIHWSQLFPLKCHNCWRDDSFILLKCHFFSYLTLTSCLRPDLHVGCSSISSLSLSLSPLSPSSSSFFPNCWLSADSASLAFLSVSDKNVICCVDCCNQTSSPVSGVKKHLIHQRLPELWSK